MHYTNDTTNRISSAEKKETEILFQRDYKALRRAAECHRQVRKWAQSYMKPGQRLIDIVEKLEAKNLELIERNKLEPNSIMNTMEDLSNISSDQLDQDLSVIPQDYWRLFCRKCR